MIDVHVRRPRRRARFLGGDIAPAHQILHEQRPPRGQAARQLGIEIAVAAEQVVNARLNRAQIVVLRTGGELRAHLANRKVIAPGNHDHEDQAWHKENKQNRREAHPSGRRRGVDAV